MALPSPSRADPEIGKDGYCNARRGAKPRCRQKAGYGTSHPGFGACSSHGGATEKAALSAGRAMAITMGAPLKITPFEGLMHCVYVAAGEVMFCEAKVHELNVEDDELIVAPESSVEKQEPEGYSSEERVHQKELHIWIRIRQECLDRLARFCKMVLDARVDERFASVAEGTAGVLANVVGNILDELDLTPEQLERVPAALRRHMLVLETPMMERSGLLEGSAA